jgi:hypothetical protein
MMSTSQSDPNISLMSAGTTKKKIDLPAQTLDGVKKGEPVFAVSLSTCRSGPKWSMAPRGTSSLAGSKFNVGPAPGTYNLPDDEKQTKYKTGPRFSFGVSSRFGLGASPSKKAPGPGAYNPVDPNDTTSHKVGFGTSLRGRVNSLAQNQPGPGAYEVKSTLGTGLMFTARGRLPAAYQRSRSLPGPGAYNPSTISVFEHSPKTGFGTSTRADMGAQALRSNMPGPGTYELAQQKSIGKDAKKFSICSRRRVHDLQGYCQPGPGAYNAHSTSFGY